MTQEELEAFAQTWAEKFWADAGNFATDRGFGLTPESRVVDVGGYLGDWTAYITSRYDAHVAVYEPVPAFVQQLRERFKANPKVEVHPFGLDDRFYEPQIALMDDASSTHRVTREDAFHVTIKDISCVMRNTEPVDLMMLNGEGCEYGIIRALGNYSLLERFGRLLIQFHAFYPGAEREREIIRSILQRTHREEWCYPFVWECWRRR